MKFDFIATIEIDTVRYPYKLNSNGTRNINKKKAVTEHFTFKFDVSALSNIIFRDSPRLLYVDSKEMCFDFDKMYNLSAIHFESDNYIWIIIDPTRFLSDCKEAFLSLKVAELSSSLVSKPVPEIEEDEDDDEPVDEFDLPDNAKIVSNKKDDSDDDSNETSKLSNSDEDDDSDSQDYFY